MKKNMLWLLVLCAAFQWTACSKGSGEGDGGTTPEPPPVPNPVTSIPQVDENVRDFMARYNVPGLSIAIVKNGKLVYAKGYGFSDQQAATYVDTASLFRTASLSKPITAVAVLKLAEAGKLALTDKVFGSGSILGTEYGTPPYQNNVTSITVQQLLQHTSGGWPNDSNDPMFTNPSLSATELISWTLNNRPLTSSPGTSYAYSNFGYSVLGRVIEKASGMQYADYVKTAILHPIGITRMSIAGNTAADRKPGEVRYYGQNGQDPYAYNVARMDAHGGWIASAKDLMKLLVAIDGFATKPDILGTASIQAMSSGSGANAGYGLGWMVNSTGNWWHTGSLPGTATMLARTANGYSWAILTNTRSMEPNFGSDMDQLVWKAINNAATQWPEKDLF